MVEIMKDLVNNRFKFVYDNTDTEVAESSKIAQCVKALAELQIFINSLTKYVEESKNPNEGDKEEDNTND